VSVLAKGPHPRCSYPYPTTTRSKKLITNSRTLNGCQNPFQKNVKWISTSISLFFLFFNETDVEICFIFF